MKKKLKVFFTLILAIVMFLGTNQFSAKADTITDSSVIENIVKNSVSENIGWKDVYVSNIKNVYDFNDKLVAYSVDLKDKTTGSKGYEIISANSEDGPVLEFSKEKYSPYDKISNKDKCIYNGVLNYYSKNNTSNGYYDIKNNSKLNQDKIKYFVKTSKNKEYRSTNPNKSLKTYKLFSLSVKSNNINKTSYNENKALESVPTEKLLEDVPDYIWYKGCTPTAIAMVLEYDFSDNTPEYRPLVDELALAMGTDSIGNTNIGDNVTNGIKTVMKNFGANVWCQFDGNGKANSTYSKYVNEINANHPVVVGLDNSKETSMGYPNGFGNHSAAGMGYKYSNNENFIVIHDDSLDGDVYCDFNSSALGNNQWLYIH